jgi:hypothetical protein
MTDSCTIETADNAVPEVNLYNTQAVNPGLMMSIILPVRNEEDNLIHALDALRMQFDGTGRRVSYKQYEVLLLANNCTDRSVSVARAYQRRYPRFGLHVEEITLPKPVAHIGTVRRLLMDAAYERFNSIGKPNGIIASTDSDSQVAKDWVYQTCREIANGNDVVGGRILTRPDKGISRLYYLRDITYKYLVSKMEDLLDPVLNDRWPRHFQCFGASFAVTSRMYDICGRLPVVPFLEDMALHRALIRVDAKIRLSPLVQVLTSTRVEGRVDFGLSIQLKQWGEMNECHHPLMVESTQALIIKLNARKLLRDLWTSGFEEQYKNTNILVQISDLLSLEREWLGEQVRKASYFGALWELTENELTQQGWASKWPMRNVVEVIPELKKEIWKLSYGT